MSLHPIFHLTDRAFTSFKLNTNINIRTFSCTQASICVSHYFFAHSPYPSPLFLSLSHKETPGEGGNNLCAGDGAKLRKLLVQPLIVDDLVEVLDVEVDALEPPDSLRLELFKPLLQLGLPLHLLLGAASKDDFAIDIRAIDSLHSLPYRQSYRSHGV